MSEGTSGVRREMDATRARMSETIGEIEARLESRVDRVKQRFDVLEWAREHPWPAIGLAIVAGVALSRGADARVASATVAAAKNAPGKIADVAKRGAAAARERFSGDGADATSDQTAESNEPGFVGRTRETLVEVLAIGDLEQELRSASEQVRESGELARTRSAAT